MSQWNPPHLLPEVPKGRIKTFIVAVRRGLDGKVYCFPACYLNHVELIWDDDRQGNVQEDGEGLTTGWYTEKDHADFDTAYYPLDLSDGKDTLVGWQPLPVWHEADAAQAA